jgi:hypothetical protein
LPKGHSGRCARGETGCFSGELGADFDANIMIASLGAATMLHTAMGEKEWS